jgi:hypothetical protein
VQDNISIILPLVFHLASTHLGRDTQRQIHWSVDDPRGSETPTPTFSSFDNLAFLKSLVVLSKVSNHQNIYDTKRKIQNTID